MTVRVRGTRGAGREGRAGGAEGGGEEGGARGATLRHWKRCRAWSKRSRKKGRSGGAEGGGEDREGGGKQNWGHTFFGTKNQG